MACRNVTEVGFPYSVVCRKVTEVGFLDMQCVGKVTDGGLSVYVVCRKSYCDRVSAYCSEWRKE